MCAGPKRITMEELTTNIEKLLAAKNYAELTASEREMVAKVYSRAKYEQLRQVILSTKALPATIQPPKSLKADLMKAFRKKHQRRNIPLSSITMPFWQAAAIAACMVLMGQFVRFGPVHAHTPSMAWETHDSLWFKKVTQIVADTALAVFAPSKQEAPDHQEGHILAASTSTPLPQEKLLPQAVSDTPGWAKRSALGAVDNTPLLLMVY